MQAWCVRTFVVVAAAGIAGGCGGNSHGPAGSGGAAGTGTGAGGLGAGGRTGAGGGGGVAGGGSGGGSGGLGGAGGADAGAPPDGGSADAADAGAATDGGGQDGAVDGGGCAATPKTRTYKTLRLFDFATGDGRAFPVARAGGGAMAVYKGQSAAGMAAIVASTAPAGGADGGGAAYNAKVLSMVEAASPPDLRLTGGGAVRLAYLGSGVTYGVRYLEWAGDPSQAATDVAVGTDSASAGAPVLALDGADRAFVAYFDLGGNLRLAARAGSDWTVETVASGGMPQYTQVALAVDASGAPHVITTGTGSTDSGALGPMGVWAATRDSGGTWTQALVHGDASDHSPRAVRAPSGDVTVLFASKLKASRAVLHAGAWQVDAPLGAPGAGGTVPLDDIDRFDVAIASDGAVHLAAPRTGGGLSHLVYNTCGWFSETVDPSAAPIAGPAITLDAADVPTFAYQKDATDSGGGNEVWYASP
jgi:hypothetical protein